MTTRSATHLRLNINNNKYDFIFELNKKAFFDIVSIAVFV